MASALDLFRCITSFAPRRIDLSGAPWEAAVPWLIANGLGPIAAYNLEYRLGDCGAPAWALDRLLSVFQGTANDNVMKLVTLKRILERLSGRTLAILGGVSALEGLYPHAAFRPLTEARLHLAPQDREPLCSFLRGAGFEAEASSANSRRAEANLTDTRTQIFLHTVLSHKAGLDQGLRERSLPMKVYGPSARRLDLEDAILVHILLMARANFQVPWIELVDLRELLVGAPALGGAYSRALEIPRFRALVTEWSLERSVYAALAMAEGLFPEVAEQSQAAMPSLNGITRKLLDRVVVRPLIALDAAGAARGARLQRLLIGR